MPVPPVRRLLPYRSITAAIVPKCRRAPSYGSVTIGTTSYLSIMPAGIMSLNFLAVLTASMELSKNSSSPVYTHRVKRVHVS